MLFENYFIIESKINKILFIHNMKKIHFIRIVNEYKFVI